MKESITKFDLEAAFKALDDLETPTAEKGIRANKPALNEIFSRKSKFDALFEEYYDIGSNDELSEAQEAREAEVAKAKLARIEKIVDLDADSPDELLASYVGKYIIQCPQCMTLFYKNPEDVETSEEDSSVVNINEVCQHCGNESGYTLIGKVGEAEEELPAETAEATDEEGEDAVAEEPADKGAEGADEGEATAEEGEEGDEFDLSDLDFEDTEEEATEESFANTGDGSPLLEQLEEDAEASDSEADDADDADISDAEFRELLTSDEFTTPVSNKAAKAMLDNLDEAAVPCEELEEALDGEEELTEASFLKNLGKLGKAAVKGTKKTANKANDAFGELADKALDKSMTREEKVDWLITHMLKPEVKRIELDQDGKIIPNRKDQVYNTFAVMLFEDCFSDGETINASPDLDDEDLMISDKSPQFKKTYADAEKIAIGWSKSADGGPAGIFMTDGETLKGESAYLCQFFKGELDTRRDKLEIYFKETKDALDGLEKIQAGGGIKDNAGSPQIEKRTADSLTDGTVIRLKDKDWIVVSNTEVANIPGTRSIVVKASDAEVQKTLQLKNGAKVTVVLQESVNKTGLLSTIMESVDSLDEETLEKIITESLTKSYKNVTSFKLENCSYLNEEFTVAGKVLFESGNTRDLTYTFNEAVQEDDKVVLHGLNEKLGADKIFKLTGKATAEKTFIVESLA
jgi:hypothetical protein